MENKNKKCLIIGAGPAGLAASYYLLKNSDIKPIIIEQEEYVGGLSRTVDYKGYLIDIGPHRFFSKSETVNKFWSNTLDNNNFFTVKRLTRIFYLNKFFNYPINLSWTTIKNLGISKMIRIVHSYIKSRISPIKPQASLADFYTNKFGKELYNTFFKDYTKKVWGVPCEEIPADWGSQRIKGVSLLKIFKTAILKLGKKSSSETSLIEKFLYPKFGAGHMYESIAKSIKAMGGEIRTDQEIIKLELKNKKILSVTIKEKDNNLYQETADNFISSMPIKDLIEKSSQNIPKDITDIASGLIYRDYILVGLLFKKLKHNLSDNWIYIQEKGIKMGRLDIVNNFSKAMLKDECNTWLGGEYFCNENDDLWKKSDSEIKELAIKELQDMDIAKNEDFLDFVVVRQKKAYPAYFGSYNNFSELRNYLDKIENLYLIGRNGMHKYNNMDHSILSGFTAAQNIINNIRTKDNIWNINTEDEYHEIKKTK